MTAVEQHKCPRCAQLHGIEACPYVKAVQYGDFGAIVRVEFLTPADMAPITPTKPDEPAPVDYPRLKPHA